MGRAEEDVPPAKRVKTARPALASLSNFTTFKANKTVNPLEASMAKPLPSEGKEDMVGPKGVIRRVEFIRIITKALYSLGYERSGALLEEESGIHLHSSIVNQFRNHILEGNWSESIGTLNKLGLADEKILKSASFLILEKKLFEHLEKGRVMEALKTLRREITPLGVSDKQIHELAGCIVSPSKLALRTIETQGLDLADSRIKLLENLQKLLPPSIMIPERRLELLVEQALSLQREACLFHNSLDSSVSLYSDHQCGRDQIPSRTTQILQAHEDEVWFVQFSNDGKYLASSSSDKSAIVWEVHEDGEVSLKHRLSGHQKPVLMVAWSPDDRLLLTCGMEEVVKCWDVSSGQCLRAFEKSGLNLISCGWLPDGQWVFCGLTDGSICMWDLEGKEVECWRGQRTIKIADVAVTSDGQRILSICRDTAILVVDRETKAERLIEEEHVITSFMLSRDDRLLLLNLINQEIHLWSLNDMKLLAKYSGHKRTRFVIRSCFGGIDDSFIASGSEDSLVYLWHRSSGERIEALPGHSGAVNCVSWNPANPHMLASGSDDRTIRIWGLQAADPTVRCNGAAHLCNGRSNS
ncbi:transducin family protein / WD-40 repeat family protein [Wolffia australiana]